MQLNDLNDAERRTRRRAVARFVLGNAQMFTAATACVLLLQTGVNRWTLGATTVATALTLTSRVLFRAERR